jgi:ribosomal protein S18 acetylase RimI-like enzyme
LLFKQQTLDRIARGEVTVAFRIWRRPTVKTGGRLRTAVGELAIDLIVPTALETITREQAEAAGFRDRDEALAALSQGDGQLYRIEFRLSGADRRAALANKTDIDNDSVAEIHARLRDIDRRSRTAGWTKSFLGLVRSHPGKAAAELAGMAGVEKVLFKRRMRQLKELGLTQSLDVGYQLSPRGAAFRDLQELPRGSGDERRRSNEPLFVRGATRTEVDALATIWFEGWNDAHARILPPELARFRTLGDLRARLSGNLENTIVATSQDSLVGLAMMKKDELDQLYVSHGARGSGAAGALVTAVLERMREEGYRRAWLACAIGNDRAARFYEKFGWSRTGTVTIHLETPEGRVPLDVWRYEICI